MASFGLHQRGSVSVITTPLGNDKEKLVGTVIEALPDTTFRVKMDDGHIILAYLSGKMRLRYIRVMLGDRVSIVLSPDGERGRIVYRL